MGEEQDHAKALAFMQENNGFFTAPFDEPARFQQWARANPAIAPVSGDLFTAIGNDIDDYKRALVGIGDQERQYIAEQGNSESVSAFLATHPKLVTLMCQYADNPPPVMQQWYEEFPQFELEQKVMKQSRRDNPEDMQRRALNAGITEIAKAGLHAKPNAVRVLLDNLRENLNNTVEDYYRKTPDARRQATAQFKQDCTKHLNTARKKLTKSAIERLGLDGLQEAVDAVQAPKKVAPKAPPTKQEARALKVKQKKFDQEYQQFQALATSISAVRTTYRDTNTNVADKLENLATGLESLAKKHYTEQNTSDIEKSMPVFKKQCQQQIEFAKLSLAKQVELKQLLTTVEKRIDSIGSQSLADKKKPRKATNQSGNEQEIFEQHLRVLDEKAKNLQDRGYDREARQVELAVNFLRAEGYVYYSQPEEQRAQMTVGFINKCIDIIEDTTPHLTKLGRGVKGFFQNLINFVTGLDVHFTTDTDKKLQATADFVNKEIATPNLNSRQSSGAGQKGASRKSVKSSRTKPAPHPPEGEQAMTSRAAKENIDPEVLKQLKGETDIEKTIDIRVPKSKGPSSRGG